jgi:hypothetical protein
MTAQEIFDICSKHLLTQMRRSIGEITIVNDRGEEMRWDSCRYRSQNGDKCAIGPLIPDADYNPQLEGLACNEIIPSNRDKAKKDFDDLLTKLGLIEHLELLNALQQVHDRSQPHTWRMELMDVAEDHGLVMA